MAGFDQSWLSAHNAKMAAFRGEPIKPPPLMVEFSIPVALKLPNRTNGQHWSAAHAYRKELLPLVAEAVKPWAGHLPMERARVTIKRYSVGVCDPDAVPAACKPLIDLLLAPSKVHPHSFGLIQDDSPAHIELVAVGAKAASRAAQRTVVLIEQLHG